MISGCTLSSPIMQKLGSVISPSNISGETSSAIQVLPNGVKPVWAGAQGDCSGLGVDRVVTLVYWFFWLGLCQQRDS